MPTCLNCNAEVSPDQMYCPDCRDSPVTQKSAKFCENCGVLDSETASCPQCGHVKVPPSAQFNTSSRKKPAYIMVGIAIIAIIIISATFSSDFSDTNRALESIVEESDIQKNIESESAGNNPNNLIKLPYAVDSKYMLGDNGIGDCEMTINGLHPKDRHLGVGFYRVNMMVKTIGENKVCEINGYESIKNTRDKFVNIGILLEHGEDDMLISIGVNAVRKTYNFDQWHILNTYHTVYGFTNGDRFVKNRDLGWTFDEPNEEKEFDLIAKRYDRENIKNIELKFADMSKILEMIEQKGWGKEKGVDITLPYFTYSKYLEARILDS